MRPNEATAAELRKFSFLFGVVSLAAGGISLYKGTTVWPWFAGGALLFFLTGILKPTVLRPLYVIWMKFALALGWINTRIILGIVYFLIFTPVAVALRIFRKDPLGRRFDRKAGTYWVKRVQQHVERKRYEQMF